MRIFRISNVLILALASGLGGALFWTSQTVQVKQDELAALMQHRAAEEESLSVLSAEWDYLNRPQRLEQLAHDYLNVEAPEENRIVSNASVIPEPSAPIIPPQKPTFIPAMVRAPVKPAPAPTPVIQKNDSRQFDALLQQLNGGGE